MSNKNHDVHLDNSHVLSQDGGSLARCPGGDFFAVLLHCWPDPHLGTEAACRLRAESLGSRAHLSHHQ